MRPIIAALFIVTLTACTHTSIRDSPIEQNYSHDEWKFIDMRPDLDAIAHSKKDEVLIDSLRRLYKKYPFERNDSLGGLYYVRLHRRTGHKHYFFHLSYSDHDNAVYIVDTQNQNKVVGNYLFSVEYFAVNISPEEFQKSKEEFQRSQKEK